jgi:hypothetical protein
MVARFPDGSVKISNFSDPGAVVTARVLANGGRNASNRATW